jgi:hypothetical protein
MDIAIDAVRAKARKYEGECDRTPGGADCDAVVCAGSIAHLREPWIVAGQVWAVLWFCGLLWKLLWKGPHQTTSAEPCLVYPRREFQNKRQGLLWLRGWVWLLIPAVAASWRGGSIGPIRFIATAW